MNIEVLQSICKKLLAVTEEIKWEDHLCFCIGGKMFLVTAPDHVPVTASFKVTDEEFEELSEKEGFSPAQYVARYKWVFVNDIRLMNKKQWEYYIHKAYDLIKDKLPNKTKKQLGI